MVFILTEKQTEKLVQSYKKYWGRSTDETNDIKNLLNTGYKLKAFTDKIYDKYREAGINDFWDVMCESGSLGHELNQFKLKKGSKKDAAFDVLYSCQQLIDLWLEIKNKIPETREEVARVGLAEEYDEIVNSLDDDITHVI